MKFIETARFRRAYKSLPQEVKSRAKEALRTLEANIRYPSLHAKKIKGTKDIREARIGLDYRLTFELIRDYCILRNIGHHDPTLKRP